MVTPGTTAMATILNVWSHRAMIHKNREMISWFLGLIRYCGCAFQATFSIMQCQGAQDGDWKWRRSCWSFRYSDKSERRGDQEGGEERDWVRRRGRGWRRRGGEECLQIWIVPRGSLGNHCPKHAQGETALVRAKSCWKGQETNIPTTHTGWQVFIGPPATAENIIPNWLCSRSTPTTS